MDNRRPFRNARQHRKLERERKRVARACDECRRQKEKCDGGVPCARCSRLGRQCQMTARNAGDAIPAAATASAISLQHGTTTASSSGNPEEQARRLAYLERIVQNHAGAGVTSDLESLRKLAEATDSMDHRSNRPADESSDSSEFHGVDDKISMLPLPDNITHFSGEFSHWNFSMRIKNWIDRGLPATDHSGQQPPSKPTKFKEHYRAEELQTPSSILSLLSLLPPRDIAEFLIYCFFKHAEANYFYVQRDWIDRKLKLAYETPSSFCQKGVDTVCIIFMLLAIGTQYAYLESLTDDNDALSRAQEGGPGRFSEDSVGVAFYQQACRLLPDVMTVSSLESVQACLLMGIYTLPMDASGLSYIYLNLALKLAVQNGMHREYPNDTLDISVRETRNRVWWTVYTIEKRVGIFHGRPRSIAGADVDADLPVDRTDIWPSSSLTHTTHLLATLQLNMHLDKIAEAISGLRTRKKTDMSDTLTKLVKLQNELRSWWDSLPNDTLLKEPISLSDVSRQRFHLKLEYCLIRMFVGRVFILTQENPGGSSPSRSPTDTPGTSSNKKHLRSVLVDECVEAALSVMDICRAIRSDIGLARASYTEFSSCRAALLVITTQCLHKRTHRFRQALRDGLDMLKEMSGSESAHSETSLIEAFERAISKIDTSANRHSLSSGGTGNSGGYGKFKRWEQMWTNATPSMGQADWQNAEQNLQVASQEVGKGELSTGNEAATSMSSFTPFFGVEGNFASFPQSIDDFTSFFGDQFGSAFDPAE